MIARAAPDFAVLAKASESAQEFAWVTPGKLFSRDCPLCRKLLKIALIGGETRAHCSGGCAKDTIFAALTASKQADDRGQLVDHGAPLAVRPLPADLTSWRLIISSAARDTLGQPEVKKWLPGSDRAALLDQLFGDLTRKIAAHPELFPKPAGVSSAELDAATREAAAGALAELLPAPAAALPAGAQGARGRRVPKLTSVREYLDQNAARRTRKCYWGGIVFAGDTVAVLGRAFSGKSTFACALGRSLTLGEPFLTRLCAKARVAYYALERGGSKVARLFDQWGLADEIQFLDALPPMDGDTLATYLKAEITRLGIEVLIIDHAQNLLRIEDTNAYAAVELALEPLAQVARETNAVIVILHHQGKSAPIDGEIGVMGSEAWRAASDVLVECTRSGDQHFVRAETRGDSDLPRTIVKVDLVTGQAEALDAGEVEAREAEGAIMKFVASQPDGADTDTISAEVGGNRAKVLAALNSLFTSKALTRDGRGKRGNPFVYRLPDSAPIPDSGNRGTQSVARAESSALNEAPQESVFRFPNSLGRAGTDSENPQSASLSVAEIQFPASGNRIQKPAGSGADSTMLDARNPDNAGTAGITGIERTESTPGEAEGAEPDFEVE